MVLHNEYSSTIEIQYADISIIGQKIGHYCVNKTYHIACSPVWGRSTLICNSVGMSFYTCLTINLDPSNTDEIWVPNQDMTCWKYICIMFWKIIWSDLKVRHDLWIRPSNTDEIWVPNQDTTCWKYILHHVLKDNPIRSQGETWSVNPS